MQCSYFTVILEPPLFKVKINTSSFTKRATARNKQHKVTPTQNKEKSNLHSLYDLDVVDGASTPTSFPFSSSLLGSVVNTCLNNGSSVSQPSVMTKQSATNNKPPQVTPALNREQFNSRMTHDPDDSSTSPCISYSSISDKSKVSKPFSIDSSSSQPSMKSMQSTTSSKPLQISPALDREQSNFHTIHEFDVGSASLSFSSNPLGSGCLCNDVSKNQPFLIPKQSTASNEPPQVTLSQNCEQSSLRTIYDLNVGSTCLSFSSNPSGYEVSKPLSQTSKSYLDIVKPLLEKSKQKKSLTGYIPLSQRTTSTSSTKANALKTRRKRVMFTPDTHSRPSTPNRQAETVYLDNMTPSKVIKTADANSNNQDVQKTNRKRDTFDHLSTPIVYCDMPTLDDLLPL